MVAPSEGTTPNLYEAFTQLHLGQPLALAKCTSGDRRDGGIDPNTDYILRRTLSTSRPDVDEDLGNASRHDVYVSSQYEEVSGFCTISKVIQLWTKQDANKCRSNCLIDTPMHHFNRYHTTKYLLS
jgi:hypothetical protein